MSKQGTMDWYRDYCHKQKSSPVDITPDISTIVTAYDYTALDKWNEKLDKHPVFRPLSSGMSTDLLPGGGFCMEVEG